MRNISFIQQAWLSGLRSKLPVLLTLLLFSVLTWRAGVWLAQTLEQAVIPELPQLAVTDAEVSHIKSTAYLLWRQVDITPPDKEQSVANNQALVPTRLSLSLLGVIKLDKNSVAIIGDGGRTLVLLVGEMVQPDVRLLEVGADFVILDHRGQHEKLVMEDGAKGLVSKAVADSPASADLNTTDQHKLESLTKELRQNPMRIGHYIDFQAIQENGKWLGIRIAPKNEPQIFTKLGFRPNDLVKMINGKTIAEMAQNPAIWNGFLQESRFNLQVERGGLLETIDVNLE